MNIVFMGTPDFAVPSLEKLHQSPHQIKAVVTGVDKRRGRGGKRSPTAVKNKALDLNLPVIETDDVKSSSFREKLQSVKADLFVVVAFKILPESVLEIPPEGAINLHASRLPAYRGAAPIHWTVINGDEETGCTVFKLDETVDTGEIIARSSTEIGKNETTGDLYGRLKKQGARLLRESVDRIADGNYSLAPQDNEQATPAPKIFNEDCKINFHQPAEKIHNKIRGCSPIPGAWAELDNLKFMMYRSKVAVNVTLKPGQIAHQNGNMIVGCQPGAVLLKKVKLEGKKKMSGDDFMNGYHGTGVLH